VATAYSTNSPVIHVEDLSVVFGNTLIIKDIEFHEKDIQRVGKIQGQTIAFVGRSGRGKSTLFRALAGLTPINSGKILIPDMSKPADANGVHPLKEVYEGDVGFVDQKYTLFRHKTVYQALQFAMRNSPLNEKERHDKILDHLADWGLEKVKNQYPSELSGGQRQRTAILEQLLSSSNYIIMDEPFSGLDIGNIQNVRNAFQLINQSHELNTIIFSTHDIELAVELADSIHVIGYPKTHSGGLANYGTLLKHYDLKAMGLAWSGEFTKGHQELSNELKKVLLES
jgi:ABC-type nitrate/sulfonate/bicarbonate transport system ATPase subunit